MRYLVDYTEPDGRATTTIDIIEAPAHYTAEDYMFDCYCNADDEWVSMLERGMITIVPEPDEFDHDL